MRSWTNGDGIRDGERPANNPARANAEAIPAGGGSVRCRSRQTTVVQERVPDVENPAVQPVRRCASLAETNARLPAILGTISTITGVISFVGSVAYATLYIEYWQAYMDDCPSYVLETQWYYAKPNYTDLVKTYQYKFHSIRPDEAGGACMNY